MNTLNSSLSIAVLVALPLGSSVANAQVAGASSVQTPSVATSIPTRQNDAVLAAIELAINKLKSQVAVLQELLAQQQALMDTLAALGPRPTEPAAAAMYDQRRVELLNRMDQVARQIADAQSEIAKQEAELARLQASVPQAVLQERRGLEELAKRERERAEAAMKQAMQQSTQARALMSTSGQRATRPARTTTRPSPARAGLPSVDQP